jgi:hypothetical protein
MAAYSFNHLPHVLQNALQANDTRTIYRHMPSTQYDLNAALLLVMPHSSIPTVELLISAGASLTQPVFHQAMTRADPAVFAAFVENGWDIDSTPAEDTAVQSVQLLTLRYAFELIKDVQLGRNPPSPTEMAVAARRKPEHQNAPPGRVVLDHHLAHVLRGDSGFAGCY